MQRSMLLEGILAENAEAARAQVWIFDHATFIRETGKRVRGLVEVATQKFSFAEPLRLITPSAFSERLTILFDTPATII